MDWSSSIKPKPRTDKNHDSHTKILFDLINQVTDNTRIDNKYKHKIRFSKFPLCGLLHTRDILKQENKIHFSMDWFTEIGTGIHNAFQLHFPLTKDVSQYVFGDWKCSYCRNSQDEPKITARTCTTPPGLICPECRSNEPTLSYSELEVNYRGITGHIDLILLINGVYYLIDFKSCSQSSVDKPDRFLPYPKNVMQIELYCYALQYQFNIKITHYTLLYVSRDSTDLEDSFTSTKKRHHFHSQVVTPKILELRKQQLDRAVITKRLVKKFLLDPSKKNLKLLNDDRPCKSLDDYEDKTTGMKYAFMRKECPYLQSCCQQGKKWTRASLDLLELVDEKEE